MKLAVSCALALIALVSVTSGLQNTTRKLKGGHHGGGGRPSGGGSWGPSHCGSWCNGGWNDWCGGCVQYGWDTCQGWGWYGSYAPVTYVTTAACSSCGGCNYGTSPPIQISTISGCASGACGQQTGSVYGCTQGTPALTCGSTCQRICSTCNQWVWVSPQSAVVLA